jgi:hypothetical protein
VGMHGPSCAYIHIYLFQYSYNGDWLASLLPLVSSSQFPASFFSIENDYQGREENISKAWDFTLKKFHLYKEKLESFQNHH